MVRARLILSLVLLVWSAAAATAQTALPALFDVANVASDDVLNIRAAPSSGAPIVGALSFAARNVEVVETSADGRWGRVNTGEQSGWAHLSFLSRVPGQPDSDLPQPLTCFGTEPFWSLTLEAGEAGLSTPGDVVGFDILTTQRASGRTDRYSFIATQVLRDLHGVVRREMCNDGMSDRAYGLDVDLIVLRGGQAVQLSGCCSVALQ
ncbi:COG3650 family protein [Pseudaestuariivita atlantica]|uniref:SH3b domain-containing protein n=1 Tax=Pseudaestuariivita atlantica TaxID=1317121 RepID=A0A0L1JNJ6_9RHOB|nr:SH3 domain-containing protein [Pseudaestuariivita atlantica]KNG93340.1 hypothetical protein ATO11_12930 [Pseudaestuariivita atlantica]